MLEQAEYKLEARSTHKGGPHLRVEALSKSFGDTRAVDAVGLSIAKGEFVTLLGDSGCGKTEVARFV